MRQKIDISDVEQATKIRAKYLRALENEEFGLLPGTTFVRSFLRTYAQYLGIDAHVLLEEYRARYEPHDDAEMAPIAPRPQSARPGGRPPGPRGGLLVLLGAIALLAFFLVLGITGGEEDDGGDEAVQEQPRQREEEPAEREGARGDEEEQRSERPRRVRVRVVPSAPVYVCWDRGPDTDSTELSALAEPQTFRGRRIRLNIGNPSATVTVDGEPLALEGTGPFGFDLRPGREPREIPIGERPCQ